jgi:hypothetical protein
MANLLYNNVVLLIILISIIQLNLRYFKINLNLFNLYLIYHGFFTIFYIFIFTGKPTDHYTYLYLVNTSIVHDGYQLGLFLSTHFVYQIIIFLKFIHLNDFNIIVIFSLLSFFGIIIFIQNLIKLGVDKKIAYIIFFIPGIHFWTGIIVKDCLILFFLALFFNFYIDKKLIYSIIFLIPVFLIRPHIGIVFFLALGINQVIMKKSNLKILYLLILFFGIYIFFNLPQIQKLIFNTSDVLDYNFIHKILMELNNLTLKYDSSNTVYEISNIYMNIFNYIIFPLEFVLRNNSLSVNTFVFIEIITLIFVIIMVSKQKNKFKIDRSLIYFLFLCIFIYTLLMPQVYFNYGLNARQKWMIIPFIIYFSFLLKNVFVKIKKM